MSLKPFQDSQWFRFVSNSGFRIPGFVASRLLLMACFLALLCPIASRAESVSAAFEAANKLYDQGKISEAVAAYEKLLHSGQASAAIYFNLGNAAFKSGQIGRAIAAYRQAECLTPRDPDVRANLQFARNQIQGPTLTLNAWQRWLGKLSLNEWTWLTTGGFWLLLLVLILRQWRPALKPRLRYPVLALAAATVLLGFCLGSALFQVRGTPTAVVIAREAVVRHGPLEESQTAFTVHDGAEVRILDQKEDWLQVSTDPRRIGWLRRTEVLLPQSL